MYNKDSTKSWVKFRIGVSCGTTTEPKTLWLNCLLFGSSAERVLERVNKGDCVYVTGRIEVRPYINKNNEAATDSTLIVNHWQNLSKKTEEKQLLNIPEFDGIKNENTRLTSLNSYTTTDDFDLPF
jgi:single-stranded DNA-binding protein